jgi:hypothetical protein
MATFANDLRLKEIATGDESGTWGTSTNTNLALIADAFSLGTKQMAADADETFTMPDASADGTRSLYLKITSAVSLTVTRTVTLAPNTVSKIWIIENATSGGQSITIAQGSGSTVTIANGSKVMIATDGAGAGAAVVNANPSAATGGTVTSVGGTGTVNGITLTGTVTSSGNLTLGGTLANVNLTSQVTGTLPIANGGTGSTSTTFANLTTNVTGTLPVGNGGTGATTLTANNVILGNGTSAVQFVAPGTTGNVLTSDGTTWQSTAPAVTATSTTTFTNKRIDPRVVSAASASSLTPDISAADQYAYTALAAALTINAPIGTPVNGNKLIFRLLDNGTARALTWNATYTVIGVTLPTTTVINKTTYVGCIYNANNTRWDVIAVTTQA